MAEILELIGLIYDAVADASRWPVFLEAFVRTLDGRQGALSIGDGRWEQYGMVCRYGWSEQDIRIYMDRYAAADPWVQPAKDSPEGTVASSHDLWPEHEMENSPFYRDYLASRDWYYGMGGVILRTETSMSAISMLRGRGKGPCEESERSLLRTLLPHLRRAALLHGELSALRARQSAFTGHLDRYPQGFLLTDQDRHILFANRAGHEFLASGDSLRVEAGRLGVPSAKDDAALSQAIRDAAAEPASWPRQLEIRRTRAGAPYRILLMPVPSSGALPLGVAQPAVAILIVDPESARTPDPQILADLFSLTPAEARVTGLLVLGKSLEEIAESLDVSLTTVRTHLRNVLSKTGTNRQGALISLVLRAAPFDRI